MAVRVRPSAPFLYHLACRAAHRPTFSSILSLELDLKTEDLNPPSRLTALRKRFGLDEAERDSA